MDDIAGSEYFACLELKFAYWQVHVREEDQAKTAFVTYHETFMWTHMPFGLKSIFANLQPYCPKWGVRVYLDDNLVFAPTFDKFVRLLDVLCLLHASGFKVSLDKCKFALEFTKFLGFILSKNSKHPDPAKSRCHPENPAAYKQQSSLVGAPHCQLLSPLCEEFGQDRSPLEDSHSM